MSIKIGLNMEFIRSEDKPFAAGVAGKLISGWGLNGISTFQTGYPLQMGTGQNLCGCFGDDLTDILYHFQ